MTELTRYTSLALYRDFIKLKAQDVCQRLLDMEDVDDLKMILKSFKPTTTSNSEEYRLFYIELLNAYFSAVRKDINGLHIHVITSIALMIKTDSYDTYRAMFEWHIKDQELISLFLIVS